MAVAKVRSKYLFQKRETEREEVKFNRGEKSGEGQKQSWYFSFLRVATSRGLETPCDSGRFVPVQGCEIVGLREADCEVGLKNWSSWESRAGTTPSIPSQCRATKSPEGIG